jgi:hypothetical protein
MLKAHLRDDAEEWCDTQEDIDNWRDWKKTFLAFFCTFRWVNKWHRELTELKQGKDESIDVYYAAYRRLIRKIDQIEAVPNKDKLRYFLQGLKTELAPLIMIRDPSSVSAVVELIRKYEAGEDVVR